MSTYETIDYAVQDATAVITLDRPDDLNTIVPPMLDELEDAVTQSIRDRAVKVILLQGAGARSAPASTSPAASRTGTRTSRPRASGTPGRT